MVFDRCYSYHCKDDRRGDRRHDDCCRSALFKRGSVPYVVFRFESPLYFATLGVFKQTLFTETVSLTRLKAANLKAKIVNPASKSDGVESSDFVSVIDDLGVIREKELSLDREKELSLDKEKVISDHLKEISNESNIVLSNQGLVNEVRTRSEGLDSNRFSSGPGNRDSEVETVQNDHTNRLDKILSDTDVARSDLNEDFACNEAGRLQEPSVNIEEDQCVSNTERDRYLSNIESNTADITSNSHSIKAKTRSNTDVTSIIVDCSAISFVDTGGAKLLGLLHGEYGKVGVRLILAGCGGDAMERLERVAQCKKLVEEGVYPSVQDAVIDVLGKVSVMI